MDNALAFLLAALIFAGLLKGFAMALPKLNAWAKRYRAENDLS